MEPQSKEEHVNGRRASDKLTDYRLDKLESLTEKMVKSLDILVRIEAQNAEHFRALQEVKDRQDYHGKIMDGWARELENYKVQIAAMPDVEEYGELRRTVNQHDWIMKLCLGVGLTTVIGGVLKVVGVV